jgi:acyl-CoA thioester hydrolase
MLELRVAIRWRDMDAYGHVNNATYLTYLEECRDAWVQRVLAPVSDVWDFVLAHVEIDYRSQLTQEDGEVIVRCSLSEIGRSSLGTREEILKRDGSVSAQARSIIVPRNPEADRSRQLTDWERSVLEPELERDTATG